MMYVDIFQERTHSCTSETGHMCHLSSPPVKNLFNERFVDLSHLSGTCSSWLWSKEKSRNNFPKFSDIP